MANNDKILVQDESINYYEYVVLTAGIRLERFQKNPVMLYMHDPTKLIGKWNGLTVEGKSMFAKPQFNSKNAFAKEKEQEFNDGYLNGTSLGLKVIKWANGAEYGMDEKLLVLAESELKEISMAVIGANANTVQLYDDSGNAYTEKQMSEVRLSATQQVFKPNNNTMDFKALLITTLSMSADAKDADIMLALQNLKNEAANLSAEKTEWLKKEKDRTEAAIANELKLAIDTGKIQENQKPVYEALLKADFVNGKAALDAIKPANAPGAEVNLAAVVSKSEKTDGGKEVNLADKSTWDYKTYAQKDFAGLMKMKQEKRAEYVKLCVAAGMNESDID